MIDLRERFLQLFVKDTRGAEIAEAAAVLPLMFMILLGIFWFGQAFSMYGAITRAAQEGARAGAAPPCTTCGTRVEYAISHTGRHCSQHGVASLKPQSGMDAVTIASGVRLLAAMQQFRAKRGLWGDRCGLRATSRTASDHRSGRRRLRRLGLFPVSLQVLAPLHFIQQPADTDDRLSAGSD